MLLLPTHTATDLKQISQRLPFFHWTKRPMIACDMSKVDVQWCSTVHKANNIRPAVGLDVLE